jgi:hypothetical protein
MSLSVVSCCPAGDRSVEPFQGDEFPVQQVITVIISLIPMEQIIKLRLLRNFRRVVGDVEFGRRRGFFWRSGNDVSTPHTLNNTIRSTSYLDTTILYISRLPLFISPPSPATQVDDLRSWGAMNIIWHISRNSLTNIIV